MTWSCTELKYMVHYPNCTPGPCHSFIAGQLRSGERTADRLGLRNREYLCVKMLWSDEAGLTTLLSTDCVK